VIQLTYARVAVLVGSKPAMAHFIELVIQLTYARVAQLVEHTTDTGGVLGSNPSTRTEIKRYAQ
jgi:hypothetical protein